MANKKVSGGDEIRRLCPVPRDKAMPHRYRRALEEHLHPPPDNLSIEAVNMPDDGMLILICAVAAGGIQAVSCPWCGSRRQG
jgi:hypothetical protein